MSANYKYRGRLSETTLPEMLYSIDRFQMAGLVEATHGEIVKRIWLRDGYVVHASSSDRSDSLGEHLRRTGEIDADDLDEISRLRRSSDRRFGALVVERGLLTPVATLEAIRSHIEAIVWSLFAWQQGEVSFAIGDGAAPAEDMVRIQLPLGRVIVSGIRRMPRAKSLVSRLGSRETVLVPCFEWEELIEIGLDDEEMRMLRLVDGRKSLYELCSAGPLAPADNARILYAFDVLKLVAKRRSSADPPSGPVKIRLKTSGDSFSV